jgi:hypothetical protein
VTTSIVCWKWHREDYRSTYTAEHVNTLFRMVQRHTTRAHQFVCVTDDPVGIDPRVKIVPLWDNPCPNYGGGKRPNCFYRLRAFDPAVFPVFGDKFIWLDLDCVIVRSIDNIISHTADFAIWRPDGERMPCNGSLVLNKTGTRNTIWTRFDKRRVHPERGLQREGVSGSDQAWIALNLKSTDARLGKEHGIYSWRSHVEPLYTKIGVPDDARIVFFNGADKPWSDGIKEMPWIREHYK